MASPTVELQNFTQSVYLVIKGRYFDDIAGEDGVNLVNMTIDWTNQFLDELETETDTSGKIVNWRWMRNPNYELGTATEGDASIVIPTEVLNLIADEDRYVQILQDGTPVSNWAVVDSSEISSKSDRIIEDMCAQVGENIVFSRAFRDSENGGTIVGDVTLPMARLSTTNVKALSAVKPKLLLILGVAKNASLPDIVQGKLSPNYAQKFNDLLQNAIARNSSSSLAPVSERDDFGYISGIGF